MKTRFLSLIIALAILITTGGVYAAWNYATTPLQTVHGHIGSMALENATINIAKGTIAVNATGAHLLIDQKDYLDYTAVLKAEGTIVVTFTPTPEHLASLNDAKTITMYYHLLTDNNAPLGFKCPDNGTDKQLFTKFDTNAKTAFELERRTDGGNIVYTATIDAEVLLDLITLNDTFELESYADYQAFSGKLGTFGNIGFAVSETNT